MTLELKQATKVTRGITHIKPASLILKTGRFNVLLGQTGSGKTSLIKLMAGLDPLNSGEIWMDGENVSRLSTQKRNISLVHQFFVNYPQMSVFDNIASPLRVAGMAKSEIQGRVEEAADILQLRPMLNRRPQELSGGNNSAVHWPARLPRKAARSFWTSPWPIWITSCAKNCVSNCPSCLQIAVLLSFMQRPNRKKRFCWGATRR